MATNKGGGGGGGTTVVRLELYACKLKNARAGGAFGGGMSDPYAVVTVLADNPNDKPRILGKTEVIQKTFSPRWTKSFELQYSIGRLTRFNVGVYDDHDKKDKKSDDNSDNKPMGSAMFEVGEVLGAHGNIKAKKLRAGGTLFVRITPAYSNNSREAQSSGIHPETACAAGVLHLTLRGVSLKNIEGFFSKSDPFLEVSAHIQAAGGPSWQTIYRSKHIDNNLNPQWPPFTLDLDRLCGNSGSGSSGNGDIDLNRPIRIHVYDWQKNGKHQSMGFFETTVNVLLNHAANPSSDRFFELFKNRKSFGKIVVAAARIEGRSSSSAADTAGSFSSAIGPASPLAAAMPQPPEQSQQTSQTPASWKAPYNAVSAANSLYTVGGGSSSSIVPMPPPVMVPIEPLPMEALPPPPMAQRPHFVDYLTGGLELELTIAIDFTGSNGDPRIPGALHYIHKDGQLNDYEKAITAVGSIIARYDSDQAFSCLGFGAKFGGVIQHCFQIGKSDKLQGIAGVLVGYRQVFETGLTMSGPTVFAEIIDLTAARARSKQDDAQRKGLQAYQVLLILTDGAVTDIQRTIEALQYAADAPLSIVIVGIGNADFGAMQFLDDFQRGSGGRDICQFVEFRRYQHNKSALTQATLEEIPDQLVDYFYNRGIMPLPAMTTSQLFSLNDATADEGGSGVASDPTDQDTDLSVEENSNGEFFVAHNPGAVYDDTKYDTAAMYIRPSTSYQAAAAATAPPSPYQYGPAGGQQQFQHPGTTDTAASYHGGYGGGNGYPQQQQHYSQPQYYQQQQQQQPRPPPLATDVIPATVFHVQVPPGITPGQQLQIQNPRTQQFMIVTVPPGVAPGGKFAVRY
jgi:Copine/C2 domain